MISPLCRPCRAMHPRWTPCICLTSLWRMQESTSAWPRAATQDRQFRPCSRRGWTSCPVRTTNILLVFEQLCNFLHNCTKTARSKVVVSTTGEKTLSPTWLLKHYNLVSIVHMTIHSRYSVMLRLTSTFSFCRYHYFTKCGPECCCNPTR